MLGTRQGIRINLPDQRVDIGNPLGTGKAGWSDRADLASFSLEHAFDLSRATAPVFSFASSWGIEASFDYGYAEVSTDAGATWTALRDTDGRFVDDGNGGSGLTGTGEGTLRFDLSAYAGQEIVLRLRYVSDIGGQWTGWWADDFLLRDGARILFADDVESGAGGWTSDD